MNERMRISVDPLSQRWLRVALINFLLAALLGALLRYAFVEELSWMKYRQVQHAHSHVAMLGWLFMGLFALMLHLFLPGHRRYAPRYRWLFAGIQGSVIGMLIAFPLQGYAFWSILFSTLHVLVSYGFAWQFWRDLDRGETSNRWSVYWIKAALGLMLLSTLALWAMPVVMVLDPDKGAWYYLTIQFYLHFQLNGWFLFAAIALGLRWLESLQISFNETAMKPFFWLLLASTGPTYALALRWANPLDWLFYVNGVGVGLQLLALAVALRMIRPLLPSLAMQLSRTGRWLLGIAGGSLAAKILIQGSLILPVVAEAAYTIHNYVIGFIHLITLGIMAHALLGLAYELALLPSRKRWTNLGLGMFSVGFITSEILLFGQGTLFWAHLGFLPGYYPWIFAVSCLMLLGILVLVIQGDRPYTRMPRQPA